MEQQIDFYNKNDLGVCEYWRKIFAKGGMGRERAINVFSNKGIKSLDQLRNMGKHEVLKIKNFGERSFEYVIISLDEMGIKLWREDYYKIVDIQAIQTGVAKDYVPEFQLNITVNVKFDSDANHIMIKLDKRTVKVGSGGKSE